MTFPSLSSVVKRLKAELKKEPTVEDPRRAFFNPPAPGITENTSETSAPLLELPRQLEIGWC